MTALSQTCVIWIIGALILLRPCTGGPVYQPALGRALSYHHRSDRAMLCALGMYWEATSSRCQPCRSCPKGSTSANDCDVGPGTCQRCELGYFQPEDNSTAPCDSCNHCYNRKRLKRCSRESNAVCGECREGHYNRSGVCVDCSTYSGRYPPMACRDKPKTTMPVFVSSAPSTTKADVSTVSDDATTHAPTEGDTKPQLSEISDLSTIGPGSSTELVSPRPSIIQEPKEEDTGKDFIWNRFGKPLSFAVGLTLAALTLVCFTKMMIRHLSNLCNCKWLRRFGSSYSLGAGFDPNLEQGNDDSDTAVSYIQGEEYVVITAGEDRTQAGAPTDGSRQPLLTATTSSPRVLSFSELMLRLDGEFKEAEGSCLGDFTDHCVNANKLTPLSAERAANSLMICSNLVIEANDWSEERFIGFLYRYFDLRHLRRLCGIIERNFPEACKLKEAESTSEVNYLQLIEDHLIKTNDPSKPIDVKAMSWLLTPLLDSSIKGVGGVYQLAIALEVDPTTAHELRSYGSLESLLHASYPDLPLLKFAAALTKIKRKLAVKRIYEHLVNSKKTES